MTMCNLCKDNFDSFIWQDEYCCVVVDRESDFTGWSKVIWKAHITEFSQFSEQESLHIMRVLKNTELALLEILSPDKINIMSLGMEVPHFHWHVIPRYKDDSRYPYAVSAPELRVSCRGKISDIQFEKLKACICKLQSNQHVNK